MPKKQHLGRPRKSSQLAKRTTRVNRQVVSAQESKKSFLNSRWTESYTSLLMGIVVVIVSVLFIVSFLKQSHHIQDTSSIATAITPETTTQPTELLPEENNQKTYTVKAGDDLWHIAEKFYNSGYNWVDIAKANNLSDPSTIHSGNILTIPKVTPQVATITITPLPSSTTNVKMTTENAISGKTYTVQKGDDLWDIALRAYGDGYRWVDIAKANDLVNPGLIFSGNVLTIPR